MQLINYFKRKRIFQSCILPFLFLSFIFIACDNDKKKGDAREENQNKGITLNCVTLTRAQVQSWVDSGWTKPADPAAVKKILLQLYSADADGVNNNMQLIAYPGQTVTDVKINGKQTLAIDEKCETKTLKGPVVFGNNEIDLAKLNILKADGTLEDFDFIRFTPVQSTNYPPYIVFKAEISKKGMLEEVKDGISAPCPPYCCPPYCNDGFRN